MLAHAAVSAPGSGARGLFHAGAGFKSVPVTIGFLDGDWHTPGAKYLDVWTGRPIKPHIVKDIAYLSLELDLREASREIERSTNHD